MKKYSVFSSVKTFLFSALFLLSWGCQKNDEFFSSSHVKVVCSTTGMITDLARIIGGEHVKVKGLMGPGVDPHLYRATAGDVSIMDEADMILYNGLHLEGKMEDLFRKMSRKKMTVAITKDIPREKLISIEGEYEEYDPHIWFDVTLWMYALESVKKSLSQLDPEHAKEYEKNAANYLLKLQELEAYIHLQVDKLHPEKRILVTAHDAFGYFGRAYGFNVVALQGVSTDAESGIREVQDLVEFIVENEVPAIFIETSIPEKNIQAVQESVRTKGWDVEIGGYLFSDSMGNINTPEDSYLGMCRHNIDTIVSSLLPMKTGE